MAFQKQKVIIPSENDWRLPEKTSKFTINPEQGATAIMKADGDNINIYDYESYDSDAHRDAIQNVRIQAINGNIRVVYFT